jgi:hypothetical protein
VPHVPAKKTQRTPQKSVFETNAHSSISFFKNRFCRVSIACAKTIYQRAERPSVELIGKATWSVIFFAIPFF